MRYGICVQGLSVAFIALGFGSYIKETIDFAGLLTHTTIWSVLFAVAFIVFFLSYFYEGES